MRTNVCHCWIPSLLLYFAVFPYFSILMKRDFCLYFLFRFYIFIAIFSIIVCVCYLERWINLRWNDAVALRDIPPYISPYLCNVSTCLGSKWNELFSSFNLKEAKWSKRLSRGYENARNMVLLRKKKKTHNWWFFLLYLIFVAESISNNDKNGDEWQISKCSYRFYTNDILIHNLWIVWSHVLNIGSVFVFLALTSPLFCVIFEIMYVILFLC